jgi:hypothetical protein
MSVPKSHFKREKNLLHVTWFYILSSNTIVLLQYPIYKICNGFRSLFHYPLLYVFTVTVFSCVKKEYKTVKKQRAGEKQ